MSVSRDKIPHIIMSYTLVIHMNEHIGVKSRAHDHD